MSGFGRTSAPVAICGVLRFLEALDSYKIDYNVGITRAQLNCSLCKELDSAIC